MVVRRESGYKNPQDFVEPGTLDQISVEVQFEALGLVARVPREGEDTHAIFGDHGASWRTPYAGFQPFRKGGAEYIGPNSFPSAAKCLTII